MKHTYPIMFHTSVLSFFQESGKQNAYIFSILLSFLLRFTKKILAQEILVQSTKYKEFLLSLKFSTYNLPFSIFNVQPATGYRLLATLNLNTEPQSHRVSSLNLKALSLNPSGFANFSPIPKYLNYIIYNTPHPQLKTHTPTCNLQLATYNLQLATIYSTIN